MQCLQICNSEVMETELLCDLVEVVVSLNVQVSSSGLVSIRSSSFRSFLPALEAMTYSVSDFFFLSYSHKAARHVCFCVFIGLAAAAVLSGMNLSCE